MDFLAARDHILQRLATGLNPNLVYHCYDHTVDVWKSAKEIARQEGLGEEERILTETAALYHDAGMLIGFDNHEEISAKLAAEILTGFGFSTKQIRIIQGLILSTKLPQQPSTLSQQVICDADLFYLGSNDFFVNSFKLKLEWQLFNVRNYSLIDWFKLQEQFLIEHIFFTSFSRQKQNPGKRKNLEAIQSYVK